METKNSILKNWLISLALGLFIGSLAGHSVTSDTETVEVEKEVVVVHEIVPVYMMVYQEVEVTTEELIFVDQDAELAIQMEAEEREYNIALLAQLVQAEAGNQDLMGKRLVVDVVLNRVADPRFPDTIEEVIFQMDPCVQFSVTTNGAFEKAAENITESDIEAAVLEYDNTRVNDGILYFSCTPCNGKNHFQYGAHWFGY